MKRLGYILVETIVSMGLLSVGMIAINGAVSQAIITRGQAQDYTIARFLMEQIDNEKEIEPSIEAGSGQGVFPGEYSRFSYEWRISPVTFPMPQLPPDMHPELASDLNDTLAKLCRIGKLRIVIRWHRAGLDFEAVGETLLRPGQLWNPETAPQ